MDVDSFRARVRTAGEAAGFNDDLVGTCLEIHLRRRAHLGVSPGEVQEVLEAVRQLQAVIPKGIPALQVDVPIEGIIAVSDALTEELRPWVEAQREALSPHVPGRSLPFPRENPEAALEWIRSLASRGGDGPRGWRARFEKAAELVEGLPDVVLEARAPTLEIPERLEAGRVSSISVRSGSPLSPVAREIMGLARKTDFSAWALLAHVVLDWALYLPPFRATVFPGGLWRWGKLPRGEGEISGPTKAVVTLFTPELSERDVLNLHAGIRKVWGVSSQKPLTELQREVLRIVQEMGGVPVERGRKGPFWQEVGEKIPGRIQGDRDPPKSWKATYMVWKDAVEKLERLRGAGSPQRQEAEDA